MKLRFVKRQKEVGEIESFYFTSDDLKVWQPGQYINLTMPDVPPAVAERLFSVSSAPFEEHIRITTVIGPSLFKQRMNILKSGEIIEADQLGGDFTWQVPSTVISSLSRDLINEPQRLFLAGGIGISAFRSIILERFHQNKSLNTTLLYAGKPERRPFLGEIEKVASSDKTFKKIDFIDERLTPEWIIQNIKNLDQHLIYIAGSQQFVETLGDGLVAHGIPRQQIKYDWFDNYTGV